MIPQLPRAVILRQASRGHRLHHFLWHETRNRWNLPLPPNGNGIPDTVKQKLKDLGWEPPRPSLDATRRPILDNLSGEDFLFMHRRMIARVDDQLREIGDPNYPRVAGWTTIPGPGDSDYPVPPPWFIPTATPANWRNDPNERLRLVKSDDFFRKRIRFWERQFTDPTFLRGVSLGRLGATIEFTIHNQLHNRFSAQPFGNRPAPTPDETGTIPAEWEDPRNDYLGDTYSSHVNSVFWRLHGWVDDRIEDWRAANDVFGDISWQGTWEGVVPTADTALHAAAGHNHDLHRMEEAVRALGECSGGYSFLDVGWVIGD